MLLGSSHLRDVTQRILVVTDVSGQPIGLVTQRILVVTDVSGQPIPKRL